MLYPAFYPVYLNLNNMSIFSKIPRSKVQRSKFNLSHSYKTTAGIGNLIPVLCREVLPGDIWNINTSTLVRLSPTLAPVMHQFNIRTECFFVPNRLLWRDWQDFITGGQSGNLAPVKPHFTGADLVGFGDLRNTNYDYLALPLTIPESASAYAAVPNSDDVQIDCLPFLALQLIYNEYYRDPNLDTDYGKSFPFPSGRYSPDSSDPQMSELMRLKARCWEKDYFTAALPWTQRGAAASMPITSTGDVVIKTTGGPAIMRDGVNNPISDANVATTNEGYVGTGTAGSASVGYIDPNHMWEATTQASVTINDLRRTSAIQRWLENNARGGSRYIEQILAHFGVISSDSRLQRPEFLGSGKSPVIVSEVLQTSGSNIEGQSTPQANMAGHGIGGGINHGCYRHFEEHGFIVCFASLVPRSAYIFGLEPQWFRRFDKLDYAWPELARLGEQEVYRAELDANSLSNFTTPFGYQPRYADYKYILSRTTGEMSRTLSFWQAARRTNDIDPVLSSRFNHIDQGDFYGLFPAGSSSAHQQFYMELYHNIKCSRKLPKYGVPIIT